MLHRAGQRGVCLADVMSQEDKTVGWDGSDAHHGEGIPIVPREVSVRTVTFQLISKVI